MKTYFYRLLPAVAAMSLALQPADLRAKDATIELGGLTSRVPAEWAEELPCDPQSYKEYRLDPIDDYYSADVTIYALGSRMLRRAISSPGSRAFSP
jgi:hypothetical protein